MLYTIGCRCHGAEPRMRALLHENGYPKWQSIPMVKGREACLNFIDTLPHSQLDKELDKLKGYIRRSSSWSIVIGTDGKEYKWADIGHSNLTEKLDAEIIIRDFGDGE